MAKLIPLTSGGNEGVPSGHDKNMPLKRFDKASVEGSFIMHNMHMIYALDEEEKFIPIIFRDEKQFVSTRMAEISVLGEYLNLLPPELYKGIKISCYYVTADEAKLLNNINSWHCDNFYGSEEFTQLDTIISLDDLTNFYKFLEFAFSVFHSGGKNIQSDYSHCGFIKINRDDSLLAYANMDGKVVIPSFYFSSYTDAIKSKFQMLRGWPLAYLKVCCRIQGVRMNILAKPTLEVVAITDLKSCFSEKTTFTEKCWPHPKPKSLFSKNILSKLAESTLPQVNSDNWTILKEYVS